MVQKWLAFALFAVLAGCAAVDGDHSMQVLEYGCDDLVVVGRVKTLAAGETIHHPANAIGYGVWDLQIRVKKVEHGTERSTRISASAVAHAQMREDVDFLIVLAKSADADGYWIRWANLASYSRPANACTDSP